MYQDNLPHLSYLTAVEYHQLKSHPCQQHIFMEMPSVQRYWVYSNLQLQMSPLYGKKNSISRRCFKLCFKTPQAVSDYSRKCSSLHEKSSNQPIPCARFISSFFLLLCRAHMHSKPTQFQTCLLFMQEKGTYKRKGTETVKTNM